MLVGIILVIIIPILHELTSIFYCSRQNVSEYFELQAKTLQFNAEQLKYDYTKSEAEIKRIYDKQMKIVDKFRRISDKFAVKMNKAEVDAKRMVQQEKTQKYKAEDLANNDSDIPAMSSSIF
jgi:hypothetical protein